MDRLLCLAAALVTMMATSGCVATSDSFSIEVVLENRRDAAADFHVELENETETVVWSWNQSVPPGGTERSAQITLPDGLYSMFAFTDDAGCSRGPGRYEAAKITLFIELPELGRTSQYDGSPWPPANLNCHYSDADGRRFPWT